MTLSSFTTLTLSPEPIITFNIKEPSHTLSALSHSRHFLIHILEATENGMNIASAFTQGNRHSGSMFLSKNKEVFEVEERIVWKDGSSEFKIPMLKAPGVIKVLECVVMGLSQKDAKSKEKASKLKGSGLLKFGDHVLVLGKVKEILGGEGGEEKNGLCYSNGRYRRAGHVIEEMVDEKD
jgi:flavin reductase (DIM6/NTAB) family NADH-FMN oxidoreductase RutF